MSLFQNKTILVPFDFSEPATRAIDAAIELGGPNADLHLMHVVVPIPTLISLDPALPISASSDMLRLEQAASQMKKLFEGGNYARFKRHCTLGDPGLEIANMAENIGADLIVMPSHARPGLTRLFLGSVAERVLHLSQCPVLVLRDKP
jgi:nucleotide-binding universal stress UspA family protein